METKHFSSRPWRSAGPAALLLLMLAGCGSKTPEPAPEESGTPPVVDPMVEVGNNMAVDLEALQARVDAAMKKVLQNAGSAEYRNIRPGLTDSVCGEVNPAKKGGGHSGFRPFIVGSDGVALLAQGPTLSFGNAEDPFPDLYIRLCATDEELKRLGPQLDRSIARTAGDDLLLPGVEDVPLPEPEPQPSEPAADVRPKAVPSEKMGKGDSFFDSVRKPTEPAEKGK